MEEGDWKVGRVEVETLSILPSFHPRSFHPSILPSKILIQGLILWQKKSLWKKSMTTVGAFPKATCRECALMASSMQTKNCSKVPRATKHYNRLPTSRIYPESSSIHLLCQTCTGATASLSAVLRQPTRVLMAWYPLEASGMI